MKPRTRASALLTLGLLLAIAPMTSGSQAVAAPARETPGLTVGAGQSDVIADYAVSRGTWLRQDGLTSDYPRDDASRYYHQYFRQVKTLFELRDGYKQMADERMSVLETFRRGMEDPISYLNLMGPAEATILVGDIHLEAVSAP